MKKTLKTLSYVLAKGSFWLVLKVYFRVRVRGGGRLPRRGGFILAANHLSFADPLVLGAFLRRRLWFVMAEEQFERPVVHFFSRLMDVIPIRNGVAFQVTPIKKILTLLRRGRGVVIFPEGRRSADGRLLEGQPGLGVLASRAGVPVVPVAIVGTHETYPVGRTFPRPGRVTLYAGEPLPVARGEEPEGVVERTMAALAGLLRANGHDKYLGEPGDDDVLPGGREN